jgi:hypothetical protein
MWRIYSNQDLHVSHFSHLLRHARGCGGPILTRIIRTKNDIFHFFSTGMYSSNKFMQVCVITALKIKRYKRIYYSFVIILNCIRLIQIQSCVVSMRIVSGPLKTRREHATPLHTVKSSENTNVQK